MASAWEAMRMSEKAAFAAIDHEGDNTSYAALHELVAELNIAFQHTPALASLVGEILDVDDFDEIFEQHVCAAETNRSTGSSMG